MVNFNRTTLIGVLSEDPRLAPESFGRSAATITVVVKDHFKDREQKLIETRDYFKVRLYGQSASYAAMNLGKGSRVLVNGRLKNERWEAKDTHEKRYATVVVVDRENGLQSLDIDSQEADEQLQDKRLPSEATKSEAMASQRPPSAPVDNASTAEFEAAAGIQAIPF